MSTLQCVVRCKGGKEEEFRKTTEIAGEGKDYLSSLSAGLSQMQQEVNSFLTVLVEREKAERVGGTVKHSGGGEEGVCELK